LEREFLAASRETRDTERREAAEAVARQARANRRLRLQLVVTGIALVVALIGGAIAIDQRGQAEDQRGQAEAERQIATARELAAAANANLDDDPERSILLALAAIDATRDHGGTVLREAVEALHEAVASSRLLLSVPDLGGNVDWSPDGTVFVTEGPEESGLVDIRDAETGESVLSFPGHDNDINDVAFSADGSMLATTGDDGALRLWDPTTGDLLRTFEFGQNDHRTERGRHVSGRPEVVEVWGPSFSADGTSVAASWLNEGVVRVFDLVSRETRSEIRATGVHNTSLRPDGEQIVVGNIWTDVVTVADADSGEAIFTIGTGQGWVEDVEYSPDGQWIATTGDATARIWRADTGGQRFSMAFHSLPVEGLDWSPDGSRLATVSGDGTARIAEITDDGVRERLTLSADTVGGLWGVAFSPDGSRILTGDHGIGGVKVWDVTATGGAEWGSVRGGVGEAASLAFTPDGRGILVSTGDGRVSTWDVESGERLQDVGAPGGADIARFAASPDGQLIATSKGVVPVDLWDSSTGEHLAALWPGTGDEVTDLSWSQDGELLAIALFDGNQRGSTVVVDRTGAELARIRFRARILISSVSFSPDGRRLATTRDTPRAARGVRIWDWQRGEVVRTIDNAALNAVFDPTRERIATIDEVEEIAEIWDTTTGENLVTLPQSLSAYGYEFAFSADGSQVATAGGGDGTIRLWDPETGALRLELRGREVPVRTVAFSPDGTRLAAIDADGVVRVWALDLDDLVAIATERVTRNLIDDECRQYLHTERCPEA
jgi:WD40 repeat protein